MLSVLRELPKLRVASRVALLHMGRATSEGTQAFVANANVTTQRSLQLPTASLAITPLGYGSPVLFTKESQLLHQLKEAVLTHQHNFVQTHFWYTVPSQADAVSVTHAAEPIALNELFSEDSVPRENIVLSALLDDKIDGAALRPDEKLSPEAVTYQIERIRRALDVETVDVVLLRLPCELLDSHDKALLQGAIAALESSISAGHIQGYGFAFPSSSSTEATEAFVRHVLFADDVWQPGCVALQVPVNVQSNLAFALHRETKGVALLGEQPLDVTVLAGGDSKPLHLATMPAKLSGDEIAAKLKETFAFALNVEQKYRETIYPANATSVPSPDEIAWAHILAYQHEQFDNFAEWVYIRETQILPRIEAILETLNQVEATKEFSFAYSFAIRDLLRYFDASIEMIAANDAKDIHDQLTTFGVPSSSLEEAAVRVALSSAADCVLVADDFEARRALQESARLPTDVLAAIQAHRWQL
ncbi:hypothetical protein SDRG_04242 [Saprolegnia diclina VS20]|uniref:NADP-dependent oxidoreductase domain-containing protein n=1 Tax=Saprolegnia diclina (strain VS20) TaxID=1156394 RepID=T0QV55_SAPDV|nr:hypothetical protein SDRG_04242 [Saprolegnia diclina VS20]EQC38536.1 hypothetical protein SDRG_04242 [Saprolegnia diclina VS20]|eukprot:XP_008608128.1 hypothetical protein SDRG_04242 [Saprolegnia diclina VS20]